MRTQIIRGVGVIATIGAVAVLPAQAGAVTAQAATSKSVTVTLHTHISSKKGAAANGGGTVGGSLSGTYTAKVVPPNSKYVLKVKGGTIDISAALDFSSTGLSGSWHTTGGSGIYKHVKGSGSEIGTLASSDATFKLTGKLSY